MSDRISQRKLFDATADMVDRSANRPRSDLRLHEQFARQAAERPDHIAVEFGGERISYGELDMRANQLAHRLVSLGVGPEVLVGIRIERSIAMIVAVLAVLKAGGAYVPFDPEHPAERLRFMLADTAIAVMLTQTSLRPFPDDWAGPVLELDLHDPLIASAPVYAPPIKVSARNLAYVIYTSGSTGKPKGVLVEHHGLESSTEARIWQYGAGGRMLLLSSLAFDSSVAMIFAALRSGGTLVIAGKDIIRDPRRLIAEIQRTDVEMVLCVPSLYKTVIEDMRGDERNALKSVIVAGEVCSPALVAAHHQCARDVSLFNEYGPTEASVWATVFPCVAERADVIIPIGRPIANTEIYLLDESMNLVPPGIAAELFIGGAGVARGYLNRPGLTAERFVPNPFGQGDRLYRSGDLARYRANGEIEFLGRIDHQIKIRGFRIEPGEIEAVLRDQPGILDAVVIARAEAGGDSRLVAYCVAAPDTGFEPAVLRKAMLAGLPEYMVPSAVVRIDVIPLTPNGKLDRDALPSPEQSAARTVARLPQSPLESLILDVWKEVLNLQTIGTDENFFDLGGNSLIGMRIVQQLQNILIVKLALRDLFDRPTITELTTMIEPLLDEE